MVCLACTTVLLGPDPSFKVEQAISQPCRAAKRLTGFAVRHDPPRFSCTCYLFTVQESLGQNSRLEDARKSDHFERIPACWLCLHLLSALKLTC